MNKQPPMIRKQFGVTSGFSLVEMAIVLVIVALLMAGLLPTVSSQIEQQRRNETRKYMEEARNALVGFAVINKYLPCPDTDGDGVANSPCQATPNLQFGTLPYKDLGIADKDGFGAALIYGVSKEFADSAIPFTLSSIGTLRVCTTNTCNPASTILAPTAPIVIVSRGANWSPSLAHSVDENENTDGPTTGDLDFVSRDTSTDFDDLVIWISTNTLFNRMVAAGRLP